MLRNLLLVHLLSNYEFLHAEGSPERQFEHVLCEYQFANVTMTDAKGCTF